MGCSGRVMTCTPALSSIRPGQFLARKPIASVMPHAAVTRAWHQPTEAIATVNTWVSRYAGRRYMGVTAYRRLLMEVVKGNTNRLPHGGGFFPHAQQLMGLSWQEGVEANEYPRYLGTRDRPSRNSIGPVTRLATCHDSSCTMSIKTA